MSRNTNHTAIADLQALAAAEGIPLPFPAEVIAAIEAHGHLIDLTTGRLIDLTTGRLIEHGADQRVWPTTVLEAELFVETLIGGF